jgi:hypothetical protein
MLSMVKTLLNEKKRNLIPDKSSGWNYLAFCTFIASVGSIDDCCLVFTKARATVIGEPFVSQTAVLGAFTSFSQMPPDPSAIPGSPW